MLERDIWCCKVETIFQQPARLFFQMGFLRNERLFSTHELLEALVNSYKIGAAYELLVVFKAKIGIELDHEAVIERIFPGEISAS